MKVLSKGLPKSLRWRDFASAQTLISHHSLHESKALNVEKC